MKNKIFNVIVCGPRDYSNIEFISKTLMALLHQFKEKRHCEICILEGGAGGVDLTAKQYAISHKIQYNEVKAEWDKYGRRAGLIRNQKMATMGDCCIAFYNGSKGTTNMIETALKNGLLTYVVSLNKNKSYGNISVFEDFRDFQVLKNPI